MSDLATQIINWYYPSSTPLKDLLLLHSQAVMRRALRIAEAHPGMELDIHLIADGAMLHDIGIIHCDAPRIHCMGKEPYICHGREGAAMIRAYFDAQGEKAAVRNSDDGTPVSNGLAERLARICERHTGAGVTINDIRIQHLPLPEGDYQPETMEEKLICYADKFYSKTRPDCVKTFEEACHSLEKFGHEGVERFKAWKMLFEPE